MEKLIHSYLRGLMNEEERLLFLKEVNSDASLKKQFIEMKNIYAFSSLSEEPDCVERNQASYHSFMANKRKIRLFRSILHVFKYSAAILVGMVATYAVTLYTTKPEVVLVAMQSIHVPAGQRLQFTLQDGTTVWLNARTTLTFPNQFDEKERRVMVEGEALFDVAKDAGRPFIVSSKGVDMEVLGTKFNVYGYSEVGYLCVGLLSGSLNVYREDRKTEGANLQPNQQAMVGDGYFTVEPVPDPEHFLWTEGVYSFKNESLISILRKLELYFDIKIVVEDPDIYTWEYTGKFRQRDGIDGILHIIQKIHQFTIEKDDDTNTIILR